MKQDNKPLVSIICTSFNHEKYIKECLDGFIIQQTNFLFEIIVHDDASTDATQQILQEYESIYPSLFNNIYQTENQFSNKEINIWYDIMLPKARGKYIAICEGDDYWSDPMKLQKQVNFLEANSDYVFCTHRYRVYLENIHEFQNEVLPINYSTYKERQGGVEIDEKIFSKDWFTQPLTALVIKEDLNKVLSKYSNFKYFRDYHIFYLLLQRGKGACLKICSGVYRVNDGGIASSKTFYEKIKIAFLIYEEMYLYTRDSSILFNYWKFSFVLIRKIEGLKILSKSFFYNFSLNDKLILSKYFFVAFFDSFFGKIKRIASF